MLFCGRSILLVLVTLVLSLPAEAARPSRRNADTTERRDSALGEIITEHYILRTDLPESQIPPILKRLEAMAREYQQRTRELSDASDHRRLPFHLYSDLERYTSAGGTRGSAGFYDGERLLAYVGRQMDARSWHTIQHEAFHQFLGAKLGHEIPIWLNEGLAEYFGESLYTGDGFVSGLTPPWRMKRVKETIERGRFSSLRELLELSHAQWNERLEQHNYDMAWSVVQFLAHADNGRYQEGLLQYIRLASRGGDPLRTFEATIGSPEQVQRAWEDYWLDLSEQQVQVSYAEAAVRTVCSFLGRAAAMRARPRDVDELFSMARRQTLPQPVDEELPLEVLIECLSWSRDLGNWQFDHGQRAQANVTLELRDRTVVQGVYSARPGKFHLLDTWRVEPRLEEKPRRRRP